MDFITPQNAPTVMLITAAVAALCLLFVVHARRDAFYDGEKLKRLAKKQPRSFAARYSYALWLYGEGQLAAAESEFRESLFIDPRHPQAHLYLGKALLMLGDEIAASAHFEKTTELSPLYAEAFADLGSAREQSGDLTAAEGAYLRAVALDPKLAIAHYNVARIYASMSDSERSIKHLGKAIRLSSVFLREAKSSGDFDSVCHEPEFQALVYSHAA